MFSIKREDFVVRMYVSEYDTDIICVTYVYARYYNLLMRKNVESKI